MTYELCSRFHSEIRLNRYLSVANMDNEKAYKYYIANAHLAQAFLPLMQVFEVGLRNNINASMSAHYSDPDWILKLSTLDIGSVRGSTTRFKTDVDAIIERLKDKKFPTRDRVLSETSLSFWAEFFFNRFDDILGNIPFNTFENRQTGYNRKACYDDLLVIRDYRNRVCHHDTLFISRDTSGDRIDLKRPKTIRSKMLSIMEQISPDLNYLARTYDTIDAQINRIAAIA